MRRKAIMVSKNSAPLCAIFDAVACHFCKILAGVGGVVGERRKATGHDDMTHSYVMVSRFSSSTLLRAESVVLLKASIFNANAELESKIGHCNTYSPWPTETNILCECLFLSTLTVIHVTPTRIDDQMPLQERGDVFILWSLRKFTAWQQRSEKEAPVK